MDVCGNNGKCVSCNLAVASFKARSRALCQYFTFPRNRQEGRLTSCRECFGWYISSKAVKRIESYGVGVDGNQPRQSFLLAVSGGVSSTSLLHILASHLGRQRSEHGRTAYDLHVCFIQMPLVSSKDTAFQNIIALRDEFPAHNFVFPKLSDIFGLDMTIYSDLCGLGLRQCSTPQDSLDNMMSCTRSISARAEVLQLLRTRLLVKTAASFQCTGILWGHSVDRLAAQTLTNVATGRGTCLSREICDGDTFWGIAFHYPLRDLYKSELSDWAKYFLAQWTDIPETGRLSVQESGVFGQATSVDSILAHYVETQAEKNPNVLANVVRTASKLLYPRSSECATSSSRSSPEWK